MVGISSYCPLIVDDKYYTKDYLDLIFHPNHNGLKHLNESIDRFINSKINLDIDDQIKINQRLLKLAGN